MSTFLHQIAETLIKDYGGRLAEVTLIFPNRRAGLFFKERMRDLIAQPTWSPRIMSFQDYMAIQSEMQVADKLYLTHKLYDVYSKVLKTGESFDRFYYWGQMLLKDFDDVDKYLVNPENLYANLSSQKQLDLTFDFLMPEQKEIIQRFWLGFDKSKSEQKERFEFVWDRLYKVYVSFQQALKDEKLAYEGMQYRYVAERMDKLDFKFSDGPVVFAGFNALNKAEETIISWFLENKEARIEWDLDAYYVENRNQEAGIFMREYRAKPAFAQSFPKELPNQFKTEKKDIRVIGVPQYVGQAKLMGQRLGQLLRSNPELNIKDVAVVLADEALLFPVLHSLPEEIQAINVTMGFPLSYAPINSLLEHILELQRTIRVDPDENTLYNFKPVLAIMRHPLILALDVEKVQEIAQKIEKENKVFLTAADIPDLEVLKYIFMPAEDDLIKYLGDILLALHQLSNDENSIEVEYIHHFYQILNRYEELLQIGNQKTDLASFSRLFKQLVRTERLPFAGEPVIGLQIMGVLETRNLDFKHIFVLSMNESFFPAQGGKHSFIPYNLRRAYRLPNYDQQDAIYAYLFYRLLQRSTNIELYYNTESSDLGAQEMSRFLQQLIHESGLEIKQEMLANFSELEKARTITIAKDETVLKSLNRYLNTESGRAYKRLSPSALSTYLDCRLRFYYRYVADLFEKDNMEEDVDARTLGNVLHYAMEVLYKDYVQETGNAEIHERDIKALTLRVEKAATHAFREQFAIEEGRVFYFEGKNIIAKEIIKDFMLNILKLDKQYTPFEFVGAELQIELDYNVVGEITASDAGQKYNVGLRGTIDRVDRKQQRVRLIDYKTGQDKHVFDGIPELFDRKKKNKAAFQTMYYALLYDHLRKDDELMIPAVFNKDSLFLGEDVLLVNKNIGVVNNASLYLEEYKQHLGELLSEIFNKGIPFDQTDDDRKCLYCAYNNICARG